MTGQIPHKKTPPAWRTQLQGFWSDVMDDFAASFETSARGDTALGVYIQDQTTQPIDVFFTQKLGEVTTAGVAVQGEHDVLLEPGQGAGVQVGYVIESRTAENYVQAEVIAVSGDTITVNTPWSRTFPIGVTVGLGNPNMDVLGTLAAPVVFSVDPSAVQTIDITRLIITMVDASSMDFTTLGGITPPASPGFNGIVMRYKTSTGDYINLFAWGTNGQLIERSFDHTFQSKVGGGSFGFVARSTWGGQSKRGVVHRLDGSLGESLELVVQDDLTGLDRFRTIAQGHVVQ